MLRSDHSAFLSLWPFERLVWLALAGATTAFSLGCKPNIGDDCTVSTNCSATGDRLCDTTQPGGYCTIFNCEPGTCPEDSVCINFGTSLSAVDKCTPSQGNSPYQRSFCMASCGSDGDCRAGYVCLDLSGRRADNGQLLEPSVASLGAVLAESSGSGKVCIVQPAPPPTGNSSQVCFGDSQAAAVAGSGAGASAGAEPTAGDGAGGASGTSGE